MRRRKGRLREEGSEQVEEDCDGLDSGDEEQEAAEEDGSDFRQDGWSEDGSDGGIPSMPKSVRS